MLYGAAWADCFAYAALQRQACGRLRIVLCAAVHHLALTLRCTHHGLDPSPGAAGQIPKIPANIALVKNLTVHGIYWWEPGWGREEMYACL